tara:strand:- start:1195 stop:2886 length:1692 start_codon:yes stop_codon:yes gene_type:complete
MNNNYNLRNKSNNTMNNTMNNSNLRNNSVNNINNDFCNSNFNVDDKMYIPLDYNSQFKNKVPQVFYQRRNIPINPFNTPPCNVINTNEVNQPDANSQTITANLHKPYESPDDIINKNKNSKFESDNNILLGNINKELRLVRSCLLTNRQDREYESLEKKFIFHVNSNMKKENEESYSFTLNLFEYSPFNLSRVIKCNIINASIPFSRRLLDATPEVDSFHQFIYSYTEVPNVQVVINNANYTGDELKTYLDDKDVEYLEILTNDHISENSIDGHTRLSGEDGFVLEKMTNKLAYVLGFTDYLSDNPFEYIYGLSTNSSDTISYKFENNNDIVDAHPDGLGGSLEHEYFNTVEEFLNYINHKITNAYLVFKYNKNKRKFSITNNNTVQSSTTVDDVINPVNKLTYISLTGPLKELLGISFTSLLPNQTLYGSERILLEFNESYGKNTTDFNFVVSKYKQNFRHVHNVMIGITQIPPQGCLQILTPSGIKNAIQVIPMTSEVDEVTFFRNNDNIVHNPFNPTNLSRATLELYDQNGNYYNKHLNWSATIEFTLMSDKQFQQNIIK